MKRAGECDCGQHRDADIVARLQHAGVRTGDLGPATRWTLAKMPGAQVAYSTLSQIPGHNQGSDCPSTPRRLATIPKLGKALVRAPWFD